MVLARFTSVELHMLTFWIPSNYYCQSGVTLNLRLYRLPKLCAFEFLTDLDADAVSSLDKNPPVVAIEKESLFVNKTFLSDTVKFSIERALTKSCAVYPNIESETKSFIIEPEQKCFLKENIFCTEPIRRFTMSMVRNRYLRGPLTTSTPLICESLTCKRSSY